MTRPLEDRRHGRVGRKMIRNEMIAALDTCGIPPYPPPSFWIRKVAGVADISRGFELAGALVLRGLNAANRQLILLQFRRAETWKKRRIYKHNASESIVCGRSQKPVSSPTKQKPSPKQPSAPRPSTASPAAPAASASRASGASRAPSGTRARARESCHPVGGAAARWKHLRHVDS